RRQGRALAARLETLAHELVEEKAAERLGGAGVAGEEGALDHFGQVDEGEDGPVQIGEIGLEGRPFRGGECLHGIILACADPRTRPSLRESAAEGDTITFTRRTVIPVRG